ncbi:MAG: F0F1 ATP synthase subunit B [Rhizobiaceae bacterium]
MDNSFWATVALFIFLGIVVYMKVPGMITKALDGRADKIRNDLEEARRLREEAKALLAEYQQKRKDAEAEAAGIVDAAKREAATIAAEAKAKSEDYIRRRTSLAEQKIGQAETEAVNAVRASAVDLAIAASAKLLETKDAKATADLFKASLSEVKARLN